MGYHCQRYHLTFQAPTDHEDCRAAYRSHMLFMPGFDHFSPRIKKIVLHSTSGIICHTPELYGSLNLALSCICGRTPEALKSRKSVAAFKVMAGTLVGGRCVLRSHFMARMFGYKWAFLCAAVGTIKEDTHAKNALFKPQGRFAGPTTAVGTDFFSFECGLYDYKAFEPLPGLYVQYDLS